MHVPFSGAWRRCRRLFPAALLAAGCPTVGGQAVMEGVMMRNADTYALALRMPDGGIRARRLPWFSLTRFPPLRLPFVRGFPLLVETLINGIRALNRSAEALAEGEEEPLRNWQLALTLCVAAGMAALLFVAVPHTLSLIMQWQGVGGAVEGVSFHLWDGFFRCVIFLLYIGGISLVPDIRRVFQYHGAEHKAIHAFESGQTVDVDFAARMSRLHPRCGTTFLLFVICISMVLHALLVPLLLSYWTPEQTWLKHTGAVLFKMALIIPISALAYELIRFAARLDDGFPATLLRAPGLALQRLTTREPDAGQLDVAIVALYEALGPEDGERVLTAPHSLQDDAGA